MPHTKEALEREIERTKTSIAALKEEREVEVKRQQGTAGGEDIPVDVYVIDESLYWEEGWLGEMEMRLRMINRS